jgi:hypothetical protein
MTITEIAKVTGKSEQSIRRAIKAGKLKATLIDGHYEINEVDLVGDYRCDSQSDSQTIDTDSQAIVTENEALKRKISELQKELDLIKSLKDERIDDLQKQIEDKRQEVNQQQAIIMQLSRNQQLMLESKEQKEQRRGWWSRLWKRKDK